MHKTDTYQVEWGWTGNLGEGTSGYRAYSRNHEVAAAAKATISGSSDTSFHGNGERWNPEELLVAALSQCHMHWYLALAASAGVVVTKYTDTPVGPMLAVRERESAGQFTNVLLRPAVTVAEEGMRDAATRLHADASSKCFIAGSVNFPVTHEPVIVVETR